MENKFVFYVVLGRYIPLENDGEPLWIRVEFFDKRSEAREWVSDRYAQGAPKGMYRIRRAKGVLFES